MSAASLREIGERILGARIISVGPHPYQPDVAVMEFEHRGTDDDSGYLLIPTKHVRFGEEPPRDHLARAWEDAIDWDGNLLPPRDLGEPDCRCASGMHTCGKANLEEELIVALARVEELEDALGKAREQIERQAAHVGRLRDVCHRYDAALVRISAGIRPDGTYNLSREACEQLAREALDVYPS